MAFLDNFNRANEQLSASSNWNGAISPSQTLAEVISNQCGGPSGNENQAWWTTSFNANQIIGCDVVNLVDWIELRLRVGSPGTSGFTNYSVGFKTNSSTNNIELWYRTGGTWTQVSGTYSLTISAGDAIMATAVGTTITAYHKPSAGLWVSVGSWTDSNISAAGYIGFSIYTATQRIDNFFGGNIASLVYPSRPMVILAR